MSKTRVYRIEHYASSLGPYQHSFMNRDEVLAKALRSVTERTPALYQDGLLPNKVPDVLIKKLISACRKGSLLHFKSEFSSDVLFGFQSIPQVREWFGEDLLKTLHSSGFNLVVYETVKTNLVKFKHQTVLLRKNEAELLWKQNIVSLIK